MCGAGLFALREWVAYSDSAREIWVGCREPKAPTWCFDRREFAPPNPFAKFIGIETPSIFNQTALAMAPPVFLLIGFLIGWALAGFHKPRPPGLEGPIER
jgi:hypothetical protein